MIQNKPYPCSDCSKICSNFQGLRIHKSKVHSEEIFLQCDVCEFKFSKKSELQEHLKVHKKEYQNCCPKCNKTFKLKKDVLSHLVELHQFKNNKATYGFLKPYPTCLLCNKQCKNLKDHMKQVHRSDKPFSCDLCKVKFLYKYHRDKHIKTVHEKVKDFECTICCGKFTMKKSLNKHMKRTHEDKSQSKYECKICCTRFILKGDLTYHQNSMHEKQTCTICNKVYTSKSSLYNHLKTHESTLFRTKEEKKTCTICNKVLSCKNSLYQHMKIHARENAIKPEK